MTKATAFLRQARSDFAAFLHLAAQDRTVIPECHPLLHLQMAAEKLAKAAYVAAGATFDPHSHVAFSRFPQFLSRRDVAQALGYANFREFHGVLRRLAPLFRQIDELNPSVGLQTPGGGATEGPNVEYPWEARGEDGQPLWVVPAEHDFLLLDKLFRRGDASRMLALIRRLLDRFDEIFS